MGSTGETSNTKDASGKKTKPAGVPFAAAQLDYQVTQDLVKMHTDIRFRLLAILPPIAAASVALVSAQTVERIRPLRIEPMKLGDIDRHPITDRVGEFRNL